VRDHLGHDGHPKLMLGGDRLPWVPVGGLDNYEALKAPGWQVQVYGTASAELETWCKEQGLPLHALPVAAGV
jgi:hypothetical protein